jgi:hypothetical protein
VCQHNIHVACSHADDARLVEDEHSAYQGMLVIRKMVCLSFHNNVASLALFMSEQPLFVGSRMGGV